MRSTAASASPPASTRSPPTTAAKKSPACWPAPRSPRKREPPPTGCSKRRRRKASSFRGARSASPESRDSGFSPADCPGMTNANQANQIERDRKMTGAETLDVARDAIWTIVVVSSPLMVVGLVVGVVVSLFQALTQIQEQTLVFVPKILAIFVTLLLALPFMADSLHSHMMRISSRIIGG